MKLNKSERDFFDAVMKDFVPLTEEEQRIVLQGEIISVIEMNQKLRTHNYTDKDVCIACREMSSQFVSLLTSNQQLLSVGINPKKFILNSIKKQIIELELDTKKDGDA